MAAVAGVGSMLIAATDSASLSDGTTRLRRGIVDGAYGGLRLLGSNVRHERRRKGREAAFGTSARWRG